MMRRPPSPAAGVLILALASLLLLAAPPAAAAQRLNLFIWSEYMDPAVLADFERAHDCKVVVDLYEDDAGMMARILGGGASLFDVIVPTDHRVPALIKLGLLAPLRKDNLPNLAHLEPRFLNPPFDRGNRYTVAYQWGTLGLYVRPGPDQPVPDSWAVIFDPAQALSPFTLIDSPRDLISAGLKFRGHSLNTTDTAALKDVRDLLAATKRRAVGFDGSVAGKNRVLARTARAAIVYSGEGARGMTEDPGTRYVIPKEGSLIWVDNLAILARAPHRDLAEQFINFCLAPTNSARISNFTQFATPNAAARPLIRPEDLRNPAIYPPESALARLEFAEDLGARARLHDEIWTHVKAR